MLRQFFRFARSRKIILADPARDLTAREPRGFTGQTLVLDKQRELFHRWTTDRGTHPHEALLGILALLHGASSDEVRQAPDTITARLDQRGRHDRFERDPHAASIETALFRDAAATLIDMGTIVCHVDTGQHTPQQAASRIARALAANCANLPSRG